MARHGIAGTLLLVALVAACSTEPTAPPTTSNEQAKGPDVPGVNAVVGAPGSIQLRQVFVGTATWVGSLDRGDKLWGRGSNIWNPGSYLFEDFMVIVPAHQTTSIEMWGGSQDHTCDNWLRGWVPDTYLYLFDFETKAFVDRDDDSFNCLSSYLVISNKSNAGKRYILRATAYRSYDSGDIDDDSGVDQGTGRYRLWIRTPAGPCPADCYD